MNMLKRLLFSSTIFLVMGCSLPREMYLSKDTVLKNLPLYAKYKQEVDSLSTYCKNEIIPIKNKLEAQYSRLVSSYSSGSIKTVKEFKRRMFPEDTLRLDQLNKELNVLDDKEKIYNLKIETLTNKHLTPVENKYAKVLQEYIEKNKIKLVHNLDLIKHIIYIDSTQIITKDIIKELN